MPKQRLVASFHTHFNIFRDKKEPQDAEVTIEEQIKAAGRHIRWHQRQVEVGAALLTNLCRIRDQQTAAEEPKAAS